MYTAAFPVCASTGATPASDCVRRGTASTKNRCACPEAARLAASHAPPAIVPLMPLPFPPSLRLA